MKCKRIKTNQHDTAGNPIYERICYCGTTACQNQHNFSIRPKEEYVFLTPEEEKKLFKSFYKSKTEEQF